jgi:hypothetical protein
MGLRSNDKTVEEKKKDLQRNQEALNTGPVEQRAAARKQEEKQQEQNKLFDVESARQRIKEGLLGYKENYVQYKDPDTGNIETRKVKDQVRDKQLCNEDGAGIFMDEANSFLNHNTISTYLPAKTIERKCKGTLKQIHRQNVANWHKFGVESPEDASEIISIIRNPMIDAMNKARGGRLIKNQEQIRVEKNVSTKEETDENGDDQKLGGLF